MHIQHNYPTQTRPPPHVLPCPLKGVLWFFQQKTSRLESAPAHHKQAQLSLRLENSASRVIQQSSPNPHPGLLAQPLYTACPPSPPPSVQLAPKTIFRQVSATQAEGGKLIFWYRNSPSETQCALCIAEGFSLVEASCMPVSFSSYLDVLFSIMNCSITTKIYEDGLRLSLF